MSTLSKIQLVALDLVRGMNVFTEEDLAYLKYCQAEISMEANHHNELIVYVMIAFDDWDYREHRKSQRPNKIDTQAEFSFAFERGEDNKLTGNVRGGFFDRSGAFTRTLPYIKGW